MRAYVQFIAEYGRSYATKDHANERYAVFKKNYELIKVHNKHEQAMPYDMGVNQFADMSAEEFAQMNRIEVPRMLVERTAGTKVSTSSDSHVHVHSEDHFHGKHAHVTKRRPPVVSRKNKSSDNDSDSDDTDSDNEDYQRDLDFQKKYDKEHHN